MVHPFLKPSWLKVLLFVLLIGPVSAIMLMAFSFLSVVFLSMEPTNSIFLLILSVALIIILLATYLLSCVIIWNYTRTGDKALLGVVLGLAGFFTLIILIVLFGRFLLSQPSRIIHDSPAPGCVVRSGFSFGGAVQCKNKAVMSNLTSTTPSCLIVNTNRCQGTLEFVNRCGQDFQIGSSMVPYLQSYSEPSYVKLTRNEQNVVTATSYDALETQGYSGQRESWEALRGLNPSHISAEGTVGSELLHVSIDNGVLSIEPIWDCLNFSFGIFGGVEDTIIISNGCDEPVTIAGTFIRPSVRTRARMSDKIYIDIIKNGDLFDAREVAHHNEGSYYPAQNETITISGAIGSTPFTISYIKSSQLC